jgi:phosphoglycolate phosphatase
MTKDVDIFYQQMLHYYNEHCIDKTHPYNGILELLDFLKQKQLAICILSNKADELTKKIAKNLFKENTFDIVQGAIPTIPRKPNPTAALKIAKQLNLDCHEILYIGDTNIDIETAKKAGMYAVGCTWGFRQKEEIENAGADLIIDYTSDLITFLKD